VSRPIFQTDGFDEFDQTATHGAYIGGLATAHEDAALASSYKLAADLLVERAVADDRVHEVAHLGDVALRVEHPGRSEPVAVGPRQELPESSRRRERRHHLGGHRPLLLHDDHVTPCLVHRQRDEEPEESVVRAGREHLWFDSEAADALRVAVEREDTRALARAVDVGEVPGDNAAEARCGGIGLHRVPGERVTPSRLHRASPSPC
jgi:hypothetical protein